MPYYMIACYSNMLCYGQFYNFKSRNFKLRVSNPKTNTLPIRPYCLEFQIARV